MDLNKLTLFRMLKGQMGWLNRRQEVLAQNIANADTPGYKPRDLAPLDFQKMLRGQGVTQMAAQRSAPMDPPTYPVMPGTQVQQVASADPLRQGGGLAVTHPAHFAGTRANTSAFTEVQETLPFETAPNGNAVVLEEQMAKLGEVQVQHRLTTELYRKHIGLIKIAIGKGAR